MTTTINITDLRHQLQAAQQRQTELAREHAGIDNQISEAMKTGAKQRADAARNGETVGAVAADLDVEDLRRRRQELPFTIWAQKRVVAELAQDLHREELEEAQAESEKAAGAFATAQREAQEAEQVRDMAYRRHSGAGERVNVLRRQLKEGGRLIERLEGEAPSA